MTFDFRLIFLANIIFFSYLCSVKQLLDDITARLTPYYGANEARELAFWVIQETTGLNRFDARTHKGTKNIPDLPIILEKLCKFVPVQYIFSHTEWLGMDLELSPATLIPRPETAELIALISANPLTTNPLTRILDIGTGSGCIALALKRKHPEWIIEGLDKSEEAIAVARRNAAKLNLDVRFFQSDILTDDIGEYDLIVSNPPYVRPSEQPTMTRNTLLHEPHEALFVPEDDPLLFYRRIAELHKAPELWFEINEHLGAPTLQLMEQTGYNTECHKDMYGKHRFIHATKR